MADYIVWREEYNLGFEGIDAQHRRIISVINSVYNLARDSGVEGDLDVVLQKLKRYTEEHFEYEEHVLSVVEYPDRAQHAMAHRKMAERTASLFLEKPGMADVGPDEVLAFLKDWWINHIRGSDARYMNYLVKIKPPS